MVIRTKALSASWVSHPSVVLTKLPPLCVLWLDRSIIITLACYRLVRNQLTLKAKYYRSHQKVVMAYSLMWLTENYDSKSNVFELLNYLIFKEL